MKEHLLKKAYTSMIRVNMKKVSPSRDKYMSSTPMPGLWRENRLSTYCTSFIAHDLESVEAG